LKINNQEKKNVSKGKLGVAVGGGQRLREDILQNRVGFDGPVACPPQK